MQAKKSNAILWAILIGWLGTGPVAFAERPNVILILADDMAVGDLSCLNGGRSRTPQLDRLKQQSVWFEQAYSASPVCAPARAALLTGRYPHRTGVVTLNMYRYPSLTRLRQDETTLANLFRGDGYVTGMIGKWHLGIGEAYHPVARGFDEFQGFFGHRYVPSYFKYQLDIQRETRKFDDRYLTRDLSQRAIDFVRRHRDRPFFLHLAHYAPHRPIEAPEELIEGFLSEGLDRETATIYAMIEVMDEGIGRLLDELETLGISENTIVIFASDNGPDPVVVERFNRGLRGTKYTVYEGGIRVPLMIRWPARFEPGERSNVVHFVDLFPTLAEWCELEPPSDLELDGRTLDSIFNQEAADTPQFWQWNRTEPLYSHNAAIRNGEWKLVRPFVTRGVPEGPSRQPPALYHLPSDPSEQRDVSDKHPERTERMQKALQGWCRDVEADRVPR